LDDFLATAQALTRQTEKGMQYGYVSQQGESEDLAIFAAAQGVSLWDDEGRPRFDTPEALAAIQWYSDLALKHKVTPLFAPAKPGEPGPGDFEARQELIHSGRAAMWSEFYPYNAMVEVQPPVENLGWAPWPGGVVRATDFFFDGFSIAAGSEQAQACWQWITYLTGVPETVEGIPARLDVQNSPVYLSEASGVAHASEDFPLQQYVLIISGLRSIMWICSPARCWTIFGGRQRPADDKLAKIQQQALGVHPPQRRYCQRFPGTGLKKPGFFNGNRNH
jgi:hypothetical protein